MLFPKGNLRYRQIRSLGAILLSAQLISVGSLPCLAAEPAKITESVKIAAHVPPAPQPKGGVRRGSKTVQLFEPKMQFAAAPSDADLSAQTYLSEPIIPIGGTVNQVENAALATALTNFKAKNNLEDISPLQQFIAKYPDSRWRASLESNMGDFRFTFGYLSEAMKLWQSAWDTAKDDTSEGGKDIASHSAANLAELEARLGRKTDLEALINQTKGHRFLGSDEQKIDGAKQGYRCMLSQPGTAFRCGPFAIQSILGLVKKDRVNPTIKNFQSSENGTSLAQVQDLAQSVGLDYIAAKRAPGAKVITPAVLHWGVQHFSALMSEDGGKFLLNDPTFSYNARMKLSQAAIDKESDGYFLIPKQTLPDGWTAVSRDEAEKVWGKGDSDGFWLGAGSGSGPGDYCVIPVLNCPDCGMTQPEIRPFSTLHLFDTPLSYQPPFGPKMDFRFDYLHLMPGQPTTFKFANAGQDWYFNWLSYLTIDASTSDATVRLMTGGIETYNYTGGSYPTPDPMSHATLSGSGTSYTRTLPDGTVQKFNQPDASSPKNIFMTQVIDPQGNSVLMTYDTHFRITAITDSLGQVTTITYLTNTGTGANLYKIATITDPFSRSITLNYDSTSTYLLSITDVIGIKSSYSYDTSVTSDQSSFVSQLQTPYGITSFFQYVPGVGDSSPTNPTRGLKCVFPDNSWVAAESWSGVAKATYFWDRHATQLYPNEPNNSDNSTYTHCRATQWQLNNSTDLAEPVAQNKTKPLESSLTYFSYAGQPGVDFFGSTNLPATKSRNLGNPKVVATLSGTMTVGDQISFGVKSHTDTYTVVSGDTPAGVIGKIAAIINNGPGNNYSLGVKAVVDGTSLTMHSDNSIATTYQFYASTSSPPAAEITTLASPALQTADVVLTGPFSTGDYLEMDVYLPSNGSVAFYHTVTATDTPATIASDFASQINANTTLSGFNCKADNVQLGVASPVIHMTSLNPDIQAYGFPRQGSGTIVATEIRNDSVQLESWLYNAIGQMTQYIDPMGRKTRNIYAANGIDLLQTLEAQASHNFQMGAWTYNSYHQPLTYTDGSGQVTHYSYTNYSHQLASVTDANSNITSCIYPQTTSATVGGTVSNNHIETLTVFDPAISGGSKAVTYTEHTGDTTTTIAAGLAAAINGDTELMAAGISATNTANVVNLKSISLNLSTYTKTVTGSITITFSATTYGYLSQIDGPLAGNYDVTNFTWDGYGRIYTVADSEGYILVYSYDSANRQTQTLYPDGTTERIAYINMDPVLSTDRLGRSTQTSYDVMEQVNYVVDPLGRKTQYTWCTCGSIVTLTDPANNVTSWQHDLQGRTTAKIYMGDNPSAPKTTYNYDTLVGRLISMTDEMAQETDMSYYQDQTNFQKNFPITVNPTATETRKWDPNYKRLISADNDWGMISYSYYPYNTPGGAATTGGGRLSLIHNDVIANSDTSYAYDNLGRTQNRSINGSANSDTWTFDAMSRVTGETNPLGNFTYNYVDDTAGSSKGARRLASINYPNSQITNYNWYSTIADERLQQISNLKSSGGQTISQYSHRYDAAGQINQWQQLQNNSSLTYSLGYDQAGQLLSSQAGPGGPSVAYQKQNYFAYDLASNRVGAQQNTINEVRLGGLITVGDLLTITVVDSGLSGGQKAIAYTTVAGDTLAKAASGLAAAITSDSSLQVLGVNASSNGTIISIKSTSPNRTTYNESTSGGATETLSVGSTANFVENVVIGGTKTTGDTITVIFMDSALSGGQTPVTYTVVAADTLGTIATGLKNAINANTDLATLGVTATLVGATITIRSNSVNATTYAKSTNSGATETLSLSVNQNGPQSIAISGLKTTGDAITVNVYDAALAGGLRAVTYTVASGDSLTIIASNLAAALTADTNLQSVGISAVASGQVVTLMSNSLNATTVRATTSASATEILTTNIPANGIETVVIGGTKTTGNTLTVTVYDAGLAGGSRAVAYTVLAADTLSSIAAGVASSIAADTSLAAIGITATSSGTVISILSASISMTTYATSTSGGATEVLTLAPASSVTLYGYNNLNELTSIASGGPTAFLGSANKALTSATINSAAAKLVWSQSFAGNASLGSGANNVPVSVTDGAANLKSNNYSINLNGPLSQTLSFDANGNMINDGVNTYTWDADNRLIEVTYPGSGNRSCFTYDCLDGLVKIVEYTSGTASSTKQFVRCNNSMCEERDASSALTKQFFNWGETIGSTKYFYTRDHLGSVRDLLDQTGLVQGHYEYDMWGQPIQTIASQSADFGFAGYYFHQPSGLNLCTYRAYNSTLGRWINRDPIGEKGGVNLYTYVKNKTTKLTDPRGLIPGATTIVNPTIVVGEGAAVGGGAVAVGEGAAIGEGAILGGEAGAIGGPAGVAIGVGVGVIIVGGIIIYNSYKKSSTFMTPILPPKFKNNCECEDWCADHYIGDGLEHCLEWCEEHYPTITIPKTITQGPD